jgi:N-formylglutamate deformylase
VDVERFSDDAKEPMSKVGMGMIYTLTASGSKLKRALRQDEIRDLVSQYYEPHHEALLAEVNEELRTQGKALVIDCHSFPSKPLSCDASQVVPRPQFCIGTDPFHTPRALLQTAARSLKEMGYSVGVNTPFAGSLIPMAFYQRERRVASIMVEVNRSLYMDERTGARAAGFDRTRECVIGLLEMMRESEQQTTPDSRGRWHVSE